MPCQAAGGGGVLQYFPWGQSADGLKNAVAGTKSGDPLLVVSGMSGLRAWLTCGPNFLQLSGLYTSQITGSTLKTPGSLGRRESPTPQLPFTDGSSTIQCSHKPLRSAFEDTPSTIYWRP